MIFRVLNRGVGRRMLFTKDEDFFAFERVIEPQREDWPNKESFIDVQQSKAMADHGFCPWFGLPLVGLVALRI
jgi:hypothetical protein